MAANFRLRDRGTPGKMLPVTLTRCERVAFRWLHPEQGERANALCARSCPGRLDPAGGSEAPPLPSLISGNLASRPRPGLRPVHTDRHGFAGGLADSSA